MKKIISAILCIMVVFSLSACGGKVSNVKTQEVESSIYSQEDINQAIEVIKNDFKSEWKDCTLQEIYYAGDDYNKGYEDWAARNNADDVIVLLSTFKTGSFAEEGLNKNSTYSKYNWILVRSDDGQWKRVDNGY